MGKFSLNDILSERSKAQDMQSEEIRTDGVVELIDIYDMIPSQDNFYDVTRHMDLVNSIKLLGVLQPVLLTESEEPDKYSIKAGHRRREACLYLVEKEGLEKFRYIPAIIKAEQDDVMGKFTIIMANRFRDKTDWEKMQEAVQTTELLTELKGNKNLNKQMREQLKEMLGVENDRKMKTRDFVAEILGTSSAQIGRYDAIYKNLCWECMEVFKQGFINVSVAAEMAGLSPEWQIEAFEILRKNGSLQISDVTKLKQQEKESKPIEGQQTIEELNKQEKELARQSNVAAESEQFEAKPKYKDILCCEEQDRIDRETARKIEEMKRKDIEEKSLPTGDKRAPRDDFEISVTMRQYSEVYYGHINFLVTSKKDYRFDDKITLKEYRQGEATGREITVKVKNVVQDCTGIEDKYCVIGFYTVQK